MSAKATVRAPSNIAFIKYWGARDLERVIPANPSISMTLESCYSLSTVEHVDATGDHDIRWRGREGALEAAPPAFAERVRQHLDRLACWAGVDGHFRVATENSFPAAAGIASSASGFAALTLATVRALGRDPALAELSTLARLSGSGSAARSVLGGYVAWPAGPDEAECHAVEIAPADHWDLRDVVAVVETGTKEISSLDGHRRASTSPYFATRQQRLGDRLAKVRQAIHGHDFELLGEVIEEEAIDLHCVAMTSVPAIFYWKPATLTVLEAVRAMRRAGLAAAATMDAGANVHVICTAADEPQVAARLTSLEVVERVIRDGVGPGPVVADDLF